MKKLIIQIPCFNEEASLPITLAELPRSIPGIDVVEWLIIDDGSQDHTSEVARRHGVDHIVTLSKHSGLARAFMAGLEACLKLGADIIVNTDADNQYCAQDIPKLIEPILTGKAEVVIGARPIDSIKEFSPTKRFLQKLGSLVVRFVSYTNIPDAPCGLRAFARSAALQTNVFTNYTYTLETIIQAGHKGLAIASVPIRTNGELRPSRLVRSISSYIIKSILTMFRIFMTYSPFKCFAIAGCFPFFSGIVLGMRWLIISQDSPTSHLPSLIAAVILTVIGVQIWIFGFLADLLAVNRKLLEDIQFRTRVAELTSNTRGGVI